MAIISCFEDLDCWKEAREITKKVYDLTRKGIFIKDFRFIDQIRGASISIMNNIAEGFDSKTSAEFIRFLYYARRSASEVQSCIYIGKDAEYITGTDFENLYDQTCKVRQIIDGLIRYLKNCRHSNGQRVTDNGQRNL